MVAQSANGAFGVLIAKSKTHGGMLYDIFTYVYDSLVLLIIGDGAAIWGTQECACINAAQYRASRFFLGAGKYTPNVALAGHGMAFQCS